ncbi:hypothetical protein [Hyphomonas sp.]|uniref:hypothetical protein n=1 Tax=Hyphomonas sp. TaxID=87 RepID=UPI0039E521AA
MKHHIMIALGLLLGLTFALRLARAILTPGLGITEVYLAGGLVLSVWLIIGGLAEWRHVRANRTSGDETGEDEVQS